MAMLAEPKRKQKFSQDPRNLQWANDDNKFGQKMMEKMGWAKGKGLGVNLDGNTDHIKLSLKNDTRGVGATKSYTDNWIAHQDDFNDLLAQLNSANTSVTPSEETSKEPEVLSLEEKSKTAKGRVHYKKFTRGKDLSGYQKDDLASIFGQRKSKSSLQTQSEANSEAEESNSDSNNKGPEENVMGLNHVTSSTSIADYFAEKMAKLKEKGVGFNYQPTEKSSDKDAQLDNHEEVVRFGFGQESEGNDNSGNEVKDEERKKKKKKSKKSKNKEEEIEDGQELESENAIKLAEEKPLCVESPQQVSVDHTSSKKKKSKKSKKRKAEELSDSELPSESKLDESDRSSDNVTGIPEKSSKKKKVPTATLR